MKTITIWSDQQQRWRVIEKNVEDKCSLVKQTSIIVGSPKLFSRYEVIPCYFLDTSIYFLDEKWFVSMSEVAALILGVESWYEKWVGIHLWSDNNRLLLFIYSPYELQFWLEEITFLPIFGPWLWINSPPLSDC